MTPAEARLLRAAAKNLGVALEQDALDRLARFLELLRTWNRRVHLTGVRDVALLVRDHVIDSLAPVPHLPSAGIVTDIGSGAGFPGIVLGCLRPDLDIVLIESRRRPTSFLCEAIRSIPLPAVRTLEMRAEEAATAPEMAGRVTLAIARALRLDLFLGLALPLLAPHGTAIAMQTPRAAGAASALANERGFRLSGRHDYTLSGGAERSLFLFDRSGAVS